ncbi:MAG: ArsR family transcriptional regulator [Flavobacterium sp.]|uniref:ArsR/SmtB family transcription factor n=1 Tax=Flavobacterium sp. TaxID=239 RepID=UPI001B00E195|nr:metalloregulator ArsR/SmtB family transcription factor [Flavobacterium sp.]MBO9584789.1 ArsR family transcriptional regulator [Flavobacterium sp.]
MDANKRDFKNAIYGQLAKITKALANPHRMEVIDLLAQGAFSVEEIAQNTDMSVANASQHLQVLKAAGLVDIKKEGNFIFYSLSDEKVFDAWRNLRDLGVKHNGEVLATIDEFRKNHHAMEPVTMDELFQKISNGGVLLLDVRSTKEFMRGHIDQALSIPFDELSLRMGELSKEMEIIAYCRGPFCVYADQAVELLLKEGFRANRMAEGYPDWKSENLPVSV